MSRHLTPSAKGKAAGAKPGSEPDSGKPTVRDRRGASGNVVHGGTGNPPHNRKGEAGNPPPNGARARDLSRLIINFPKISAKRCRVLRAPGGADGPLPHRSQGHRYGRRSAVVAVLANRTERLLPEMAIGEGAAGTRLEVMFKLFGPRIFVEPDDPDEIPRTPPGG